MLGRGAGPPARAGPRPAGRRASARRGAAHDVPNANQTKIRKVGKVDGTHLSRHQYVEHLP